MIFKTTTRAMRRLGTVLFVLITGAASLAQAQSHSRFRIVWDNDGGMGALTLLDGGLPLQPGLARLSNLPFFYFDTERGTPTPQPFIDNDSNNGSRLFGQGAELRVRRYVVSSHRAHRD